MKKYIPIMLLILTACSVSPDHPSILDSSNCDLPCWNNIEMGKTSEQEMVDILRNLPFVDQNSIFSQKASHGIFENWVSFDLYPRFFEEVYPAMNAQSAFINDDVALLSICGDLGVTIGQIIERTGEPESIIVTRSGELAGYNVNAINPSKGINYWYRTSKVPKKYRSTISPEIEVYCLDIFNPDLYNQMRDTGFFCADGSCSGQLSSQIFHPWVGYGNINELYPYQDLNH